MIFLALSYFLGIIVIIFTLNKRKIKFSDYPDLKVNKSGISFYSHSYHRIKIDDAILMQLGNKVYLKKDYNLVIIKNIDKVVRKCDYLYFAALGEVQIFMDTKDIYKYFNINVYSQRLDFFSLRQKASKDILNNVFDINQCRYVNTFLKLMKMLNISFMKDKLVVKPNKMHLSYVLMYKLNNKIKKVNINDRLF